MEGWRHRAGASNGSGGLKHVPSALNRRDSQPLYATGFLLFEYDLSAKWLELLKEIVPGVTRAAVLRDPTAITGIGQFAVIWPRIPFRNITAV